MTLNNTISVKGCSYLDLRKALKQWIQLYSDRLPTDFNIELFKVGRGIHHVNITKEINNELFFFLVNYIKYPNNIKYNVNVLGYTASNLSGKIETQDLLIYIPDTDTEYDNVFAVTKNNKNYKYDFGGKIEEVNTSKTYVPLNVENLENPEILKLSSKEHSVNIKEPVDFKEEKRFKTISIIALLAFIFNVLFIKLTTNVDHLMTSNFIICWGIGLWFMIDYKALRVNSIYLKALGISVGLLIYGYLLSNNSERHPKVILATAMAPLTMLLVQWPIRRIYIALFKREPKPEQYGKFADMIYLLILFLSIVMLPSIIIGNT